MSDNNFIKLVDKVNVRIKELKTIAENKTNRSIPDIPIYFNVRGRVAGRFIKNGSHIFIDLNSEALLKYTDTFINQTIGHEYAHYVTYLLYGDRGHDRFWRHVMCLLGLKPSRCHTYDLTPARQTKHYAAVCDCQQHIISSVRFKRIWAGAKYRCIKCGSYVRIT